MRYVVTIDYTDMAAREASVAAHKAYLARGRERGIVTETGPFADGLGGMYILKVADEDAARAFVAADPYELAGLRLTIRAWSSSAD